MDIFGIGPLEFFFIILVALILFGPNDLAKAGRTMGRVLRKLISSEEWKIIQETTKTVRYLPNKLMREAGLDDIKKELPDPDQLARETGLNEIARELKTDPDAQKPSFQAWTTPPSQEKSAPALPVETPQAPTPKKPKADSHSWVTPRAPTPKPITVESVPSDDTPAQLSKPASTDTEKSSPA